MARNPFRLLVVIVLLIGGAWAGFTLRLETELLPLLPGHLPSVRGLAEFQRRFASEREVYVVADPAITVDSIVIGNAGHDCEQHNSTQLKRESRSGKRCARQCKSRLR